MSEHSPPRRRVSAHALLPWCLLALAWFATAPLRPLLDPDEGRYAEIPREMLATGDWVTPRFDALKYFEKPPLQYWATAAVYSVAGVSQWSSRLWSVGLAFACLPLVFAWTAGIYGRAAALGALATLGVSPFFAIIGQLNLLDAAFTFWLTAMMLAFTKAQLAAPASPAERRWMLTAWALAALAVLSKGIVVGVLGGGTLILYTLLERDARPWRRLHPLTGLALFLLIAAPWFVAVSLRNPSFPGFFFVHEHFARFLTTVHQRVEPWWFFLPLLLGGVLPWLVSLARAVPAAWRAGQGANGQSFKPLKFLLLYAALTLAFFSCSGSKLAPYILPMLPVLAVITGATVAAPGALARQGARVGAGFVLISAVGLLIYSARANNFVPFEVRGWAVAAVVLAVAGAALASLMRLTERTRVMLAVAAATLSWQFLLAAYAFTPPARSARTLVSEVRPYIGPDTPLYSVGQFRETVSPYLGRTLQLAGYEGELQFGLSEEPERRMSLAEFASRWSTGGAGVAFFDPEVWDTWRRRGLPGHVIAADSHTVAVSRL